MEYHNKKLEIYESAEMGIITESQRDELLKTLNDTYSLPSFCESFGLIPVDESTIIFESIKAELGKMIRDKLDMKVIRSAWEDVASKFTHKWVGETLDENEKKMLTDAYDVLKKENLSFMEYKKNFAKIARFVGLSTDDIILENVVFSKDEESGKDKIAVRYSKGKQQVIIPNGTCLLHVSPVANIRELRPAFRSKTVGKYMYPSPRCFFTLGREIKPTQAGLENKTTYKYTPVDTIRTAYIDPTYTDYNTGAVYIETSLPIKVMDFNEKMKKVFKENTEDSNIDKYKLLILESEKKSLITKNQAQTLLEYLR